MKRENLNTVELIIDHHGHCFINAFQPLSPNNGFSNPLISRVAPEGAEGLDGAGPEDVLVVERRDGGADERADPEDPMVVPRLLGVLPR